MFFHLAYFGNFQRISQRKLHFKDSEILEEDEYCLCPNKICPEGTCQTDLDTHIVESLDNLPDQSSIYFFKNGNYEISTQRGLFCYIKTEGVSFTIKNSKGIDIFRYDEGSNDEEYLYIVDIELNCQNKDIFDQSVIQFHYLVLMFDQYHFKVTAESNGNYAIRLQNINYIPLQTEIYVDFKESGTLATFGYDNDECVDINSQDVVATLPRQADEQAADENVTRQSTTEKKLKPGAIAGIVVGGVALIGGVIAVVIILRKKAHPIYSINP